MSTAEIIASALGGKRSGNGWIAPCPAHDDSNPSLSIANGYNDTLLLHCHAGCAFDEIIDAMRRDGLLDETQYHLNSQEAAEHSYADQETVRLRMEQARKIWHETLPAKGTAVETYLRARGFRKREIPATLRYHPNLLYTPSGEYFHAMVAAVGIVPNKKVIAVHRTYLSSSGKRKASVDTNKMALGAIKGGAIWLATPGKKLAVAEGIETAFSVWQETKIPTWAAISAKGIENLILPRLPLAQEVIICADNDPTGRRAAENAATRWFAEGRRVKIAVPPEVGDDFNDLLTDKDEEEDYEDEENAEDESDGEDEADHFQY